MIRRPPTRLPAGLLATAAGVLAAAVLAAASAVLVAVVVAVVGSVAAGPVAVAVVFVVGGAGVALRNRVQGRGRSVRVRRTRSSGSPGGLRRRRVSLGGNMQRLLHACASVDRLVDYLLDRTVEKLPAATGARFAEEWQDHRQHYSGLRLVWWALCVRATARRTVATLGPARLPRDN
jgi:hypothetical protein